MDLGAYVQIEELDAVAKANNIEVPRLRGYRLMKDENPIDIKEFIKGTDISCVKTLCSSIPFWDPNSNMGESSEYTDYLEKYYIHGDKIRWDRIHGWKRRVLKTFIHNETVAAKRRAEIFNKYVGCEDILYIHARIGGGNWNDYHSYVDHQPWFIEKVDDSFDSTYCDIYAKIKTDDY